MQLFVIIVYIVYISMKGQGLKRCQRQLRPLFDDPHELPLLPGCGGGK